MTTKSDTNKEKSKVTGFGDTFDRVTKNQPDTESLSLLSSLESMSEKIKNIMSNGLGVDITKDNREWAIREYESRLLEATGTPYNVKLNNRNEWKVSISF